MAETVAFTCLTCRVVFPAADMQREHYRTDWHRYNLKRKVAELPPVTAESFKERVLTQKAIVEAEEQAEKRSNYCKVCRKHFSSDNASQSHIRSRKHREKVSRLQQSEEARQVDSLNNQNVDDIMERGVRAETEAKVVVEMRERREKKPNQSSTVETKEEKEALEEGSDGEWEDVEGLAITDCLFCSHGSPDLESNLSHMSLAHSFFLPDAQYLVDAGGMVEYLGEKVGVEWACLLCSRAFNSVESAQRHMTDKRHTQVNFEGERALEFADFYDYRPSYPDYRPSAGEGEGEGDELVGGEGNLEVNDSLELVLPSGATLAHRSLKHFYKQNLPTTSERGLVLHRGHPPHLQQQGSSVHRVLLQYRALGYSGPSQAQLAQRTIRGEGFRDRMHQQRTMTLGCRANKLQHHYRSQTGY